MDLEEGEEKTVETVNVRNFVASRIQEINSLSLQIGATGIPSSKGLAFQHVPKHMRRRAVSHNVKRLPKRLQSIHRHQVEKSSGSSTKKPKRPSRKYRRRKSNLLEEYNRRQREHKWLETHIWHAKRFHMENKWNYRMPISPTDKGYRALYRAAKSYCAMRDISFYSCLEIQGPFNLISSKISKAFAPSNCNHLSIAAEMYRKGQRQGTMYFYKNTSYPYGYIGKVMFHWKTDQKGLWLWVHPAQKEEIIEELCNEFDLDKELIWKRKKTKEQMDVDPPTESQKLSIDEIKLEPKKLLERPKWLNDSLGVTLTDLEGVFNRIRLYGPLATQTLKETLKVLNVDKFTQMTSSPPGPSNKICSDPNNWWINYYSGENKSLIEEQSKIWKSLKNFHEVPINIILPLTVRDPRIMIPQKKEKIQRKDIVQTDEQKLSVDESEDQTMDDNEENSNFVNIFKNFHEKLSSNSPLESMEVRNRLVKEKMSDSEFGTRRAKLLIPGSKIELGIDENQVPLILIHRPSTLYKSFQNGGWDIILPAGWTMQFWIAFSYRCIRALGHRDAFHYEFESGTIHVANEDGFYLSPDSVEGIKEATEIGEKLDKDYFKYTPAKRENLIKLKCPFPFKIEWDKLLKLYQLNQLAWDVEMKPFVLRDLIILRKLNQFVTSPNSQDLMKELKDLITSLPDSDKCLIGVKLVILGRGVIESGSVISIPTQDDFKFLEYKEDKQKVLEEPPGDDKASHQSRAKLKENHVKLLASLKNKRKKLNKKKLPDEHSVQNALEKHRKDSKMVSEFYNKEINNLWLPNAEEMLKSLSRLSIGFIEYGAECYSIGKYCGLGYCSLLGLIKLFDEMKDVWSVCKSRKRGLVLIRNCRTSLIYRFATISICQLT